jgi:hypothetical protein
MRTVHALLLAVVLLPLITRAQTPTEASNINAPSAIRAAEQPLAFPAVAQPLTLAVERVAPAPAPRRSVVDKKFLLLTGLATAFTISDVELTQRCLHHGTCVELNPTLPTGHTAMYLANIPATGALFYWSYRRKAKGQRLWWLPALVDLLPHAGGTFDNTRFK